MINEFIARDRMGPGGYGARRIIAVPGEMQGEQGLLQDILRLARLAAPRSRQMVTQIAAQAHADRLEERAIGRRIAGKCGEKDGTQLRFKIGERHGKRRFSGAVQAGVQSVA